MPKVPLYDETMRSPDLKPGLNFRDPTRASADQFGAGIGRGMTAVGQGLGSLAADVAAVQAFDDTMTAKDRDNAFADWDRNAKYGPDGFLTKQGKDAIDGWKGYEEAARAKRAELGQGLSPGASRAYSDASASRLNGSLNQGIAHTAKERMSWFSQSSASRAEVFKNDALVAFNNPSEVDKNIAAGILELRERGKVEGWDADTQRVKEMEYASDIHKNITMHIAQTDPVKAEEYRQKNAKYLTGVHQSELDGKLEHAVDEEQSRRYSDQFMTRGRGGTSAEMAAVIDQAAAREGVSASLMRRVVAIESGGRPGAVTGSYKGLGQLSDAEFAKHMPEGGDILSPADNARATARKLKSEAEWFRSKYGREPTGTDIYMIHQQGQGGYDAHVSNPNAPAWQNMASTAEGRDKGEAWAKKAVWGNVPDDMKKLFPGGVESVTSGDLMKVWRSKMGEGDAPAAPAGVMRPGPTRERAFLLSKLTPGHDDSHINGMDGAFAANLAAMLQDAPPGIREGLGIMSGTRTRDRQIELFNQSDKTGRMVAFPSGYVKPDGSVAPGSNHEHGLAADLSFNGQSLKYAPKEVIDWVHANAGKYGLHFPMSWENWHVEPIDARRSGPTTSGTVVSRSDSVTPRAAMPSYDDVSSFLQSIPNARQRELTRQRIVQSMELRAKAEGEARKAAQMALFDVVERGGTPDDLPLEQRLLAGRGELEAAWEYRKKKLDGSFRSDDDALVYQMKRDAIDNPEAFAKIDLDAYKYNLSKSTLNDLKNSQLEYRKDRTAHATASSAMKIADADLEAAGLTMTGKKDDERVIVAQRIARFQLELTKEIEAFKAANKQAPSQTDVRAILDKLLRPVIFREDGMLWNSDTKGFNFERGYRPDNTRIIGNVAYESIPTADRNQVAAALEAKLKRKPSKTEVAAYWNEYLMSRDGGR